MAKQYQLSCDGEPEVKQMSLQALSNFIDLTDDELDDIAQLSTDQPYTLDNMRYVVARAS